MSVSAVAVLPVRGAGARVDAVLRDLAVAGYALRTRGIALEVLVVDAGDREAVEVAGKAAARYGLDLEVIAGPAAERAGKRGDAVHGRPPETDGTDPWLAGMAHAAERDADLVVTIDDSGRHDPMQIPHLIDQLRRENADVVVGSRWQRGSGTPGLSLGRWLRGRTASLAFRAVTGVGAVQDATTTFKVARAAAVRDVVGELAGSGGRGAAAQASFLALAVARGWRVEEGAVIYRRATGPEAGTDPAEVRAFLANLVGLRRRAGQVRHARLAPAGREFGTEHFGAAADLERLGTATRFFDWVLDQFGPHLRGHVLEVGAGFGTITRRLLERDPELTMVALEPAANLFADLEALASVEPRLRAHQQTLATWSPDEGERFDAVVYLNVLEHIEDDAAELRRAAGVLRQGGALLVFVPGLERLYSDLDWQAGHYRRYGVGQLRALVRAAGFEPVKLAYFDLLGVLPYWVVYRLLGRTRIAGSTLWGYDRVLVPVSRGIQAVLRRPPVGKNVLLVALRR
jgi:SAM-dependent methyltransferase